jgi:hypothetical protein
MKIKRYVIMLACGAAILMSAINFQDGLSYGGDATADVSLNLNDFFTVAFADGEDGSGANCSGGSCDDFNGFKLNTLITANSRVCCGITSTTRGRKNF